MNVDVKLFRQLAMHLVMVNVKDGECKKAQKALMALAEQSHRWEDAMNEIDLPEEEI